MFRFASLGCALLGGAFLAVHSPEPARAQDNEVRVGVLTDMAGSYADVSGRGSVIAAEMAIEDFGGTVLGKPITLVSADHQNKPDIASAVARRWFDSDGIDVILDMSITVIWIKL